MKQDLYLEQKKSYNSTYSFFKQAEHFTKDIHTDGRKSTGKMLKIISYQENANQKQDDITLHTYQDDQYLKKKENKEKNKCWQGRGEI